MFNQNNLLGILGAGVFAYNQGKRNSRIQSQMDQYQQAVDQLGQQVDIERANSREIYEQYSQALEQANKQILQNQLTAEINFILGSLSWTALGITLLHKTISLSSLKRYLGNLPIVNDEDIQSILDDMQNNGVISTPVDGKYKVLIHSAGDMPLMRNLINNVPIKANQIKELNSK